MATTFDQKLAREMRGDVALLDGGGFEPGEGCPHILLRGSRRGEKCGARFYEGEGWCYNHYWTETKKEEDRVHYAYLSEQREVRPPSPRREDRPPSPQRIPMEEDMSTASLYLTIPGVNGVVTIRQSYCLRDPNCIVPMQK